VSPPGAVDTPEIVSRKSYFARIAAYRWLWGFAVAAFGLDQLTKFWVTARFPLHSHHVHDATVVPGFFYLIHVGNTGAAWSMFTGQSTLLALIALGTLLAIFFWRKQLSLRDPFAQVCFGLLCGGTLGNLIDRLLHNHVTDFIDLHFGSYIYPTFNIADSAIFLGVIGYIGWSLRQPEPPAKPGAEWLGSLTRFQVPRAKEEDPNAGKSG
jgi:signal peptidase II